MSQRAPHLNDLESLPGVTLCPLLSVAEEKVRADPLQFISFFVDKDASGSKAFVVTTSGAYKSLVQTIASGADFHLYEYWGTESQRAHTPANFVVDIDFKHETSAEMIQTRTKMDAEIQRLLNTDDADDMEYVVTESDGFSRIKKAWCASTHIIFKGRWGHVSEFPAIARSVREFFITNNMPTLAAGLDMAVYSAIGVRAPNQTKLGDSRVKRVRVRPAIDAFLTRQAFVPEERMPVPADDNDSAAKRRRIDTAPVDWDEIEDIASCFIKASKRVEYPDWVRIGLALAVAGSRDGQLPRAEQIFRMISNKRNEQARSRHSIDEQWDLCKRSTDGRLTIGTYKWLAQKYDSAQYSRVMAGRHALRGYTHAEIAEFFRAVAGDSCVFNGSTWYYLLPSGRWSADATPSASHIFSKVSRVCVEGIRYTHDEGEKEVENALAAVQTFGFVTSVINVLQGLLHVPDFVVNQGNPMLHAFNDGVLDIDSWTFRDFEPDDRMSFTTGYNFLQEVNPNDVEWCIGFLKDVFTNPAVREFALRKMAKCFYGRNFEQKFDYWLGTGANGKNVTLALLMHTLGLPYCKQLKKESILAGSRQSGNATPDITGLMGMKLAYVDEVDASDKLDKTRIKWVTGGGKLTGRKVYGKEEIEFESTFNLFILSQARAAIEELDFGIRRRCGTVPFTTMFRLVDDPDPDARYDESNTLHRKRNPSGFSDEFLKGKARAFLEVLRPHIQFVVHGFEIPEPAEVNNIQMEYFKENDPVTEWLHKSVTANTEENRNHRLKWRHRVDFAFHHFKLWYGPDCEVTAKQFSEAMARNGYPKIRAETGTCFAGLRIKKGVNALGVMEYYDPDERPVPNSMYRSSDQIPPAEKEHLANMEQRQARGERVVHQPIIGGGGGPADPPAKRARRDPVDLDENSQLLDEH